jgi:rubrerythrin
MMQEVEKAIGKNRTGTATAKKLTEEMLEGTREFKPTSPGDESEVAKTRAEASRDAEPIGSIPPPASVKQAVSTAAKAIKQEKPVLFLDQLGARLAFERTGVRLYEALLSKFDIYGSFEGGPTRGELEEIRDDELAHFQMLSDAIVGLGGDPTAVTPAADIQAVLSSGVPKILADARTTLTDGLEAILTAELVDNDSWEMLVDLAGIAGEEELVTRFAQALSDEQEHLANVRRWLSARRSAWVRAALGD